MQRDPATLMASALPSGLVLMLMAGTHSQGRDGLADARSVVNRKYACSLATTIIALSLPPDGTEDDPSAWASVSEDDLEEQLTRLCQWGFLLPTQKAEILGLANTAGLEAAVTHAAHHIEERVQSIVDMHATQLSTAGAVFDFGD